jgi:hypothetical protein
MVGRSGVQEESIRVLLADDHTLFREGVASILEPASGVDLSPAWFRELTVAGAYATGREPVADGRSSFELAIELVRTAPLDELSVATYPLQRWRQAIDHALDAGRLGTTKVAFDLTATD